MNIEAKPAIYLIFCLGNQKSYVGQSRSVKKRIAVHKANLRNGRHTNPYLQSAFTKYGKNLFTFTILEYPEDASPENLTIREQYWIDFFDSMNRDKGFNMKEAGSAGILCEESRRKISTSNIGKKHTDEARKKISEAGKGRPGTTTGKKITEEHKRSISQANLGRTSPMLGREHTEETKQKMSASGKGKKKPPFTEEHRRKLSQAHKGKPQRPMSEETKQKLRDKAIERHLKSQRKESEQPKEETP